MKIKFSFKEIEKIIGIEGIDLLLVFISSYLQFF